MITPAEHAEALAWLRARMNLARLMRLQDSDHYAGLTFAEAALARHAPITTTRFCVVAGCAECDSGTGVRHPATHCAECRWVAEYPCPDATDALRFVKAVRG